MRVRLGASGRLMGRRVRQPATSHHPVLDGLFTAFGWLATAADVLDFFH